MYRLILYHQGVEYKRSKPVVEVDDTLIKHSYFLWPKVDGHEIIEEHEDENMD